jgi:hypothetical protein
MNEDWQDRQRQQHDAALWTWEHYYLDPPEDEDEDEDDDGSKDGYEAADPKHSTFRERMADASDHLRKAAKEN